MYLFSVPRPLLGWLWQVSLAGLVNFRLAFGNSPNHLVPVFSCEKALNIKKIIKIERLGLPRSRNLIIFKMRDAAERFRYDKTQV